MNNFGFMEIFELTGLSGIDLLTHVLYFPSPVVNLLAYLIKCQRFRVEIQNNLQLNLTYIQQCISILFPHETNMRSNFKK